MVDAEDVVQETFLQVWRQAARYEPDPFLGQQLAGADRAQPRHRSPARPGTWPSASSSPPRARAGEFDTSPGADRNVFFAERRARIRRALAALPAEQREVIELAFFSGLTQARLLSKTSTALGTVKTRTLLAMKKLRAALETDLREAL